MTSPRTALGIANLKFEVKHQHYYTLALVMANRFCSLLFNVIFSILVTFPLFP